MRFRRALTSVLGVSLLGLPAFVATAGTASAAETYSTTMTVTTDHKVLQYKDTFSIGGTLKAYDAAGTEHSIDEAQTVTLERQYKGTSTWTAVDTDQTYGSFYFYDVVGWKNATYRVSFAGGTQHNYGTDSDDTLAPSTASASIRVARKLGDAMLKKGNRLYLKGNVNPGWGHKVIHLQKRNCAKCKWHDVDKQRTTSTGGWKFQLGAPRTGKWYWRTWIGGTTDYIKSWSDYSYYTYKY